MKTRIHKNKTENTHTKKNGKKIAGEYPSIFKEIENIEKKMIKVYPPCLDLIGSGIDLTQLFIDLSQT